MAGSGDEPVVGVKFRCFIMDGVHHDESGGCGLAAGNSLAERFGQQQHAKPFSLLAAVDCQPGEQDHADRVGGKATDKPRWC